MPFAVVLAVNHFVDECDELLVMGIIQLLTTVVTVIIAFCETDTKDVVAAQK